MDQFFLSFAVILGIVLLSLGAMKILKQPMIIGYILAGIVISFLFPGVFAESETFTQLSQVGITFLLFIIWTELNPSLIHKIWGKTVAVWVLQVIGSSILGFGIGLAFKFDIMTSLYIGTATALSSTIVILKLLGDKDDIDTTYGRLSIWTSVSQDISVMLFMSIVAAFTAMGDGDSLHVAGILILKILGIGIWLFIFSKYLLPYFTRKIAESQEFLLLFSIGWCFITSAIFQTLGFGMEIWALMGGITLSTSPYRFEIASRMKVLKDFFIVVYFVLLGSQISFDGNLNRPFIGAGLAAVIFFKPRITMWLMKLMGHVKKNNFLTGLTLIPMSEFSFILISMGISSGAIKDQNLLVMITIIGITSILISGYATAYNHILFKKLGKRQKYIPGSISRKSKETLGSANDIVLFGFGKLGSSLYEHFQKKKYSFLIIDEHPAIINHLNTHEINCLYGDALDLEFLNDINVSGTKMVISTIRNVDANFAILSCLKEKKADLIVICIANHIHEAITLYEKGADYVIMPHYIGADHTSIMLEEFGLDLEKFLKNKSLQVENLRKKSNDLLLEELIKK